VSGLRLSLRNAEHYGSVYLVVSPSSQPVATFQMRRRPTLCFWL
jgi:hypothetical protein